MAAMKRRIYIRFRPPSNISQEPYASTFTSSNVNKLLLSNRAELLRCAHQWMEEAAEDHFLETGRSVENIPQLLESVKFLTVKLQHDGMVLNIMKEQVLGDIMEETANGECTLLYTVAGAESLLPHPEAQALGLSDDCRHLPMPLTEEEGRMGNFQQSSRLASVENHDLLSSKADCGPVTVSDEAALEPLGAQEPLVVQILETVLNVEQNELQRAEHAQDAEERQPKPATEQANGWHVDSSTLPAEAPTSVAPVTASQTRYSPFAAYVHPARYGRESDPVSPNPSAKSGVNPPVHASTESGPPQKGTFNQYRSSPAGAHVHPGKCDSMSDAAPPNRNASSDGKSAAHALPPDGLSHESGPMSGPQPEPLEVFKYTEQIADLVWGEAALMGQAVCIAGHTGCGKSTGLPVLLMREIQRRGQNGRIVITQPRRLAATKLAERVAAMLGEPLGQSVAYAIGQDASEGYTTSQLLFTTGGWLREKLLHDPNFFMAFSHVILDEAHERTVDLDMLALLIRRHRRSCQPVSSAVTPTVVVMSATMEAGVFARYFGGEVATHLVPKPLTVGGRRFPVVELTLDDLVKHDQDMITKLAALALAQVLQCPQVVVDAVGAICDRMADPLFKLLSGKGAKGAMLGLVLSQANDTLIQWRAKKKSLQRCEITDYMANLGAQLAIEAGRSPAAAAVLIFLPGMREIGQLRSSLIARAAALGLEDRLTLCILHSSVPPEEQDLAMDLPPAGCFKVVLATNIAESSITIPDVTVVIDYCMQRVNSYDMVRETEVLQLEWTSLASQKQRAGRAGRVAPGVVFRIVNEECRTQHKEYDLPAILRESLAGTVLSLEATMRALGKAKDLLQEAPQPPEPEQVVYALDYLYKTGALRVEDDQITAMGRLASRLPTSVALARLIHLALAAGRCEIAAVVVAAGMSLKTEPFSMPRRQLCNTANQFLSDMQLSQQWRSRFDNGGYCEPAMLPRCFEAWMSSNKTPKWAKTNGLNLGRMKEFESAVVELCLLLEDAIDHAGLHVTDDIRRHLACLSQPADPTQLRGRGQRQGDTESRQAQVKARKVLRSMLDQPMVFWCLLGIAFSPNLVAGTPQIGNHSWMGDVNGTQCNPARTLRLRGGKKDPDLPTALLSESKLKSAVQHMVGQDRAVTRCVLRGSSLALVEFAADDSPVKVDDERQPHLPDRDLPRGAKLMLAVGDMYLQTKQEYTAKVTVIGEDGTESIVQRVDWKMPVVWHRVTAGGRGPAQRVMPDARSPFAAMIGETCQGGGDLVAVAYQLTASSKTAPDKLKTSYTLLLPRQGGLASMMLLACLPVTYQAQLAPRLLMTCDKLTQEPLAVKLGHGNGLGVELFPLRRESLEMAETLRISFVKALLEGTGDLGSTIETALQLATSTSQNRGASPGHATVAVPLAWKAPHRAHREDPLAPILRQDVTCEIRSQLLDLAGSQTIPTAQPHVPPSNHQSSQVASSSTTSQCTIS